MNRPGVATRYVGAGVDGVGQWAPVQQRGLLLLGLGLAADVRVPTPREYLCPPCAKKAQRLLMHRTGRRTGPRCSSLSPCPPTDR